MYNFSGARDPYGYSLEDEEDEDPIWAAKAPTKKGPGMGLGKKSFSSGIGFS